MTNSRSHFKTQKLGLTATLLLTILLLTFIASLSLFRTTQAQTVCTDVIVQAGDSLSGIAARYLGALGNYRQIINATNAAAATDSSYTQITNANLLEVGWKLCVPKSASNGGSAAGGSTSNNARQPTPVPTPGITRAASLPDPTATTTMTLREQYADRWDGTGPFPVTIEYLRQQTYPGSDIVFEETLAPGSNYSRYLVSYRSEGLRIYALMTIPNGAKPATGWPAIVFNHGYIPPEIYRSTERYVAYVDGFARNGYIVLRPDYRGHGFSDGEANGAYGSPDYTIDVLNALASVKKYSDTDPDRIGMWGHSLGGYITLRAMVINSDIKAGVIWAGVVASYPDLLNRWNRPIPRDIPQRVRRWRQLWIDEFGTPEENPEFWASVSSNSYLTDLSGPIQLHHGTADEDVPDLFSSLLNDQINAVGGSVEYYSYAGDNHNLGVNFNTVMQRSVAFFDAHVKN